MRTHVQGAGGVLRVAFGRAWLEAILFCTHYTSMIHAERKTTRLLSARSMFRFGAAMKKTSLVHYAQRSATRVSFGTPLFCCCPHCGAVSVVTVWEVFGPPLCRLDLFPRGRVWRRILWFTRSLFCCDCMHVCIKSTKSIEDLLTSRSGSPVELVRSVDMVD